jgi:transcriptional regulator with XRE-family HTH domain
MANKRRCYGRKASADFGDDLRKWREAANLTQEEAAPLLGLGGKSPAAYLSQIEKGHKAIPEEALLNVPKVYNQPAEEILRRAYWPQLYLSLLTAIMEPTALPKGIEDYLKEIEDELEEKERRELARYAAFLILQRKPTVTR